MHEYSVDRRIGLRPCRSGSLLGIAYLLVGTRLQCWAFLDISRPKRQTSVGHVEILSLGRQSICRGPWYGLGWCAAYGVLALKWAVQQRRLLLLELLELQVSMLRALSPFEENLPLGTFCRLHTQHCILQSRQLTSQYYPRKQGFSPRDYCPRQPVFRSENTPCTVVQHWFPIIGTPIQGSYPLRLGGLLCSVRYRL